MQTVTVKGRDNIVIQIQGDGNTIVPGLPHLTITRYLARRTAVSLDIERLTAYAMAIPMVGRDVQMAELRRWTSDARPISVRVIVGGGGRGKTRLALEFCDAVTTDGWDAGFVTESELERFISQQNLTSWGWQRPTLIVVDYAAARAGLLNRWLVELADNPGGANKPLRMLLLERDAAPGAGWWETAFGRGSGDALAIRRLLDPDAPVRLDEIALSRYRFEILNAVLQSVGSALRAPDPDNDPDFYRRLAQLTWGGEPLFLMMAALAASRSGFGALFTLNRTALAVSLADREIARIQKIAHERKVHPELLTHMAAYATLCQGLKSEDLLEAINEEKEHLHLQTTGAAYDVSAALGLALVKGSDGVNPIQPDILGEAVVLRALERLSQLSASATDDCIVRAAHRAPSGVLSTVIRAAQDFAPEGRPEPLAWLERLVDDAGENLESLQAIASQLPEQSVALRERAVEVHGKISAIARRLLALRSDVETQYLFAMSLSNLGGSLGELGRREAALMATQEAVAIYRELAQARPDAFRPDLAASLNNLGNRLGALGRHEEALTAAAEAVTILAPHFLAQPRAFSHWMAITIRNYSIQCDELNRPPDAALSGTLLNSVINLYLRWVHPTAAGFS